MRDAPLTHVRLLVREFDACLRFYRDALGLRVTWGKEGENYASFDAGSGVALALFDRASMAEAVGTADLPADASAQDRVALIFATDDLEGMVKRLQAGGARLVSEPQDRPGWGIRTAHLRDPDGTLIELTMDLPQEQWPRELREESEEMQRGA